MNMLPFGGLHGCTDIENTRIYTGISLGNNGTVTISLDTPIDLERALITFDLRPQNQNQDGSGKCLTRVMYCKNGVRYFPIEGGGVYLTITDTEIKIESTISHSSRNVTLIIDELLVDVSTTEYTAQSHYSYHTNSWVDAGAISLDTNDLDNTFMVVDTPNTSGAGFLIKMRDLDVDREKNTHISLNSDNNKWRSIRIATDSLVQTCGDDSSGVVESFRIVKFS